MKPRIFIGSSKEALDIAYAIQDNLEHDANPTVWTQGIFQFSSNALDDLLKALQNFDFGIFVFKPDDVTILRTDKLNTIRDNVIFELGLFIGKLGKDKVFFVLPSDVKDFHLPTDLLGVNPGKYNNHREDGNLKAALGPFCNQVREKTKNFIWENLSDLANENDTVKKIAIEKPIGWEYLLASELLKSRMIDINRSYEELEKGLVFQKTKSYSLADFMQWCANSVNDLIKLITIFEKSFDELLKSFGAPGVSGNITEIKSAINKINSTCKELLAWEYDFQSVDPPDEMAELLELMKGWTKEHIEVINSFPVLTEKALNSNNNEDRIIKLSFSAPSNLNKANQIIDDFNKSRNLK